MRPQTQGRLENNMDTALRPMTASQVLDRTFYVYRNHFILFMGIALIVPGGRLIANLMVLFLMGKPPVLEPGSLDPRMVQAFFVWILVNAGVGLVVFLVGNALASSATAYAVSMVHLGRTTTIADSYRRVTPIFKRILWLIVRVFWACSWPFIASYAFSLTALLAGVALAKSGGGGAGAILGLIGGLVGFLGVLASVVWVIYAYCVYALSVPACTIEGLPAKQAMLRSKFLSKGSRWRIFGIYCLTLLMGVILGGVLELPVLLSHNIFTPEGQKSMTMANQIYLQLAQFAATALAGPIATVAMALVYYDERVRKEAFDLQIMMQAIDPAGASQPALN